MSDEPLAVLGAELGVRLDALLPGQLEALQKRLTLKTRPWDPSERPRTIECWRVESGWLWMPRNFDPKLPLPRPEQRMSSPARTDVFDVKKAMSLLDPERGQDVTVPKTIEYMRDRGDAVLISPTGTGKTFVGLAIAAALGYPIGWPVYASHMEDNVRDHIAMIGLTEDDVGVVKSDRCDLGRPLTIMYVQSLLSRRYPEELYTQFGCIVADEVNRHGAPEWKRTLELFSALHRLGMSADPRRKDGLTAIVHWTFGAVAHRAERIVPEQAEPPKVIAFHWKRRYRLERFCRWTKVEDQWVPGDPHPAKYDKVLAADDDRNRMLMREVAQALSSGRQILCLSRFVNHLAHCRRLLREILDPKWPLDRLADLDPPSALPVVRMLRTGLNEASRRAVYLARVQFATFTMASDALNVPSLDTLFFLTPPGDPLQPGGRLRWKDEGFNRRPLLIGDTYEATDYAVERLIRRRDKYRGLGMDFKKIERNPPPRSG